MTSKETSPSSSQALATPPVTPSLSDRKQQQLQQHLSHDDSGEGNDAGEGEAVDDKPEDDANVPREKRTKKGKTVRFFLFIIAKRS